MGEKPSNLVITCTQCGNRITDPNASRCPRCYKIIPIHTECTGCGKCSRKFNY